MGIVWEGWNKTLFVIVMWYYPETYSGIDLNKVCKINSQFYLISDIKPVPYFRFRFKFFISLKTKFIWFKEQTLQLITYTIIHMTRWYTYKNKR